MKTYDGMVRKLIYASADATITEEVMTVCSVGGVAAHDVTLPAAQDVAGLIFVIRCDDDAVLPNDFKALSADGANIYISDAAAANNVTMTALDDYTILYSDGNNWYELSGVQT